MSNDITEERKALDNPPVVDNSADMSSIRPDDQAFAFDEGDRDNSLFNSDVSRLTRPSESKEGDDMRK